MGDTFGRGPYEAFTASFLASSVEQNNVQEVFTVQLINFIFPVMGT